jgi:hypothetical protein
MSAVAGIGTGSSKAASKIGENLNLELVTSCDHLEFLFFGQPEELPEGTRPLFVLIAG